MTVSGEDIQLEHGGWGRVHNGIWDALGKAPLNGSEFRCLMHLFRQTYGRQCKEITISAGQWAKAVGLERRVLIRATQRLLACRVIYRIDNGSHRPATWGFNKYHEQWDFAQTSDKPSTSSSDKRDTSFAQTSDKPSTKLVTNETPNIRKKREEEKPTTQPTPQQAFFEAVCKAVGWDHKTLDGRGKGQIAQTVGILADAGYSTGDVDTFMTAVWVNDWRWTQKQSFPTLNQLRQEIGKVRAIAPNMQPSSTLDFAMEQIR